MSENEALTPELVVETSNLPQVTESEAQKLFSVIIPMSSRLNVYVAQAKELASIATGEQAQQAAAIMAHMADDVKLAKEAIASHKQKAHEVWKLWTALEAKFCEPMETMRRDLKRGIASYDEEQRRKAEAERQRLQAIADEQARKERERLEKLAAGRKTPEVKERYQQQAETVIAPVIVVDTPKTAGVKLSYHWTATVTDKAALVRWVMADYATRNHFIQPDDKAVRQFAVMTKGEIPVDGVKFEKQVR